MQKRRPVMLVVLDGWGWRDDARRQRRPAGAHAHVRSPVGELSARLPAHVGRGRRLAAWTDGQFRGRPSQYRRGPAGDAGSAAHQPRDRARRDRQHARAARPDRTAAGKPAAPAISSGWHRPAACIRIRITPRRSRQFSPQADRAHRRARLYRRPRYAAAIGQGRYRAPAQGAAAVGSDRDGQRPLLRHGPRQTLGTRDQGLPRDRGRRRAALPRCRCGDRGCLCARSQRRVRAAGSGRRLSRHARRRRRALLQFPRRPRARDSGRDARSGVRRLCARPHRAVRGGGRHDPVQRASGHLPADDLPARQSGERARRGGRRHRARAIAHGRDREISARHLFPQRRQRETLSRRGSHHGAVAEGRDLRPAARDVGARIDRQGGRGDRFRQIRPDRVELRQPRHGRAHRQPGRPRSRRSRPSMPGSGASPMRSNEPAARCCSPPTTAIAS